MTTVYVVTNPDLGWDCVEECFASEEDAKEYISWYKEYVGGCPALIVHKKVFHECFTKEMFEQ